MNFKSLIVVGLGVATLGLSLPAHADTATVITNDQSNVTTGNRNYSEQTIKNRVTNVDTRNRDSAGTSIGTRQSNDTLGNRNSNYQDADNKVTNVRRGNR
jgi:hypothetical protein